MVVKKIIFAFTGILMWTVVSTGQIVTTDPSVPLVDSPVTIYFDATQGTGGLKDYTGDVYAHTGVLTENSTSGSDWKYVKTAWGENTPETKMTRISANLYKLDIGPSIREYYNVPPDEKITHMAFVFRSDFPYSGSSYYEGKETGGQDIFVEVFDLGLNITFTTPQGRFVILQLNDSLPVSASATLADSVSLYMGETFLKKGTDSTQVSDTIVANAPGSFWVRAVARDTGGFVADSFLVFVRPAVTVEALPAGMKDGINETANNAVTLVLYAPYKDHVFVLGDFTNWLPDLNGMMNKTPDGQRYWITFDNLTPEKEYRYQYLVDDTLTVADPYCEKVLDPWNDPWIPQETYPGLIPYPTDTTTGIVSVVQPGKNAYPWKNTGFIPPDPHDLVIYELLIRDFVATHDYKTLIDTLDYFSRLGINAIELMPVNEFEGNESWGYNPSFYFAPDKYYGPAEDLKSFIDSCHGRGIAVIMDMVLNHSYGQSPLVQLYLNRTTWQVTPDNPWYNVASPNPVYSWGYDFNHESDATKYFVDRVTRYWIEKYHVDGYRFDFSKGFTNTPGDGWAKDDTRIAILKRMADSIRTVKTDAYLILEHFTENTEEKILSDYGFMLWGNANCNFSQASMGYSSGPCGTWNFSQASYKDRGWTQSSLVSYMESHDEERIMYKNLTYGNSSGEYNIKDLPVALKRAEMAGLLFFTIPGPKMLWQFEDLGYDISIDDPCRVCNKPIHWDYEQVPLRLRLQQVYSALIRLKKNEPAFETQDYTVYAANAVKYNVLRHNDMNIVAVGNFDVTPQTETLTFPSTGRWYEYFTGDSMDISSTQKTLSLNPGEYRLYTTRRLADPGITADISPRSYTNEPVVLNVWPNPASGPVHVSLINNIPGIMNLEIFDMTGKAVMKKNFYAGKGKIDLLLDTVAWMDKNQGNGIFLLRLTSQGTTTSRQILLIR